MENNILSNEEKKLCFDAFIEELKEKTLKEKQNIVINDLKDMIATFQQLCNLYNIKSELLVNREIVDVNKENYTEDDFAEAVYVYIQMYKEVLSDFLIPMVKDE